MISKAVFSLLLCYVLVSVCSAAAAATAKPAAATTAKLAAATIAKDDTLAKFLDGVSAKIEPLLPKISSLISDLLTSNFTTVTFGEIKDISKALKDGKATQAQMDKVTASVAAFEKHVNGIVLQLSTLVEASGNALGELLNSALNTGPKLEAKPKTPASTAAPAKGKTAAPKKG